jgi:5-methylcytosine-specific restriction endonuclease McrA
MAVWVVMTTCSSCGRQFLTPRQSNGGRPRTRCDNCRSNQERIDGKKWREIRAQVLLEEPLCAVAGCGRPSTEVDHVIPLQAGGAPYKRSNLRGSCKPHNAAKGARLPGVKPVTVTPGDPCKCPPNCRCWVRPDHPRHWCL